MYLNTRYTLEYYVHLASSTSSLLTINGSPISEYSIVYPRSKKKQEDAIAKLLCSVIADISGYTLEIKTDSAAPSGKEIRIGATSRDTAPTVSAEECFVGNSGDSIILYAENSACLLNAYNSFVAMLNATPSLTVKAHSVVHLGTNT